MPARLPIEASGEDEPPITSLAGPWPGVVVSNEDPLKRGHLQVRVAQLHGDPVEEDEFIPDEDLPWAKPAFPAHDLHVLEPGDGVWIEFWGGVRHYPVWRGQYLGLDDAPSEFSSAYTPTPKTRIIYTANGHRIELRWVDGEEQIRVVTAGGIEFNLKDAQALGGPLIEMFTPGQRKLVLDDQQRLIRLNTATQFLEMLDQGNTYNLTTPGNMNLTGVNLVLAFTAVTATLAGAFTLTALTGVVTIIGLTTLVVGAAAAGVLLGSLVGPKQPLVTAAFLVKYLAHDHGAFCPSGPTGAYEVPGAGDQTVFTVAD